MILPSTFDVGFTSLITTAVNDATVPVTKALFVPSYDLVEAPNGYVFFDLSEVAIHHCSEGTSEDYGQEAASFDLDVACVAHKNEQRKTLVNSVLSILQPITNGKRTQLTSYAIPNSDVFIYYLRLNSTNESAVLKTGHSTPDLTMIVLSFSGKATC